MNMIERVAKAIEVADGAEWRLETYYVFIARAAIKALREPTDDMAFAGGKCENGEDMNLGERHAVLVWQAMIDAAEG